MFSYRGEQRIAFVNNPIFDTEGALTRQQDESRLFMASQAGPRDTAIHIGPAKQEADQLAVTWYPQPEKLFKRLKWEFGGVLVLIVAHIMFVAYTDPLDEVQNLVKVLMASIQIALLVAIMMGFFVLTSQTLFVQLGRYDSYMRFFWLLCVTFVVELLLMVASKVMYIVLVLQHESHIGMWRFKGYYPLWAVQRVFLVIFWITACFSSLMAFDYRLYDPDFVLDFNS